MPLWARFSIDHRELLEIRPVLDPEVRALRRETALEVLSSFGIPPTLYDLTGEGTGRREAFRQFVETTLGAAVSDEFEKTGVSLRFDFKTLHRSEIQGRARAFGALIKGGVGIDEALSIAGLECR